MSNSITQTKVPLALGNDKPTTPVRKPGSIRIHMESYRIEADFPGEPADKDLIKPVDVRVANSRGGSTGIFDPTQQEHLGETTEIVKQKSISKKPAPTAKGNSSEVTADHSKRDAIPEFVKEINANHFLTYDGCQTRVFRETTDPSSGKRTLDSLSLSSFRNFHCNQQVEITVAGKVKLKPKGQAWLESAARRQYEGIVMAPLLDIPRHYNRWQGFAVKPSKGSWERMRKHILKNLCRNDRKLYDYFMGWLANMVQNPGKPGQVAIVLIGGQGTGKGVVGNCICDLMGYHAQHVTGSQHVTGNFNDHLEDCIFLFIDEANFAGERQRGVLKAMITEPELPIQGRYKNLKGVPNMLNILMASNDDFVVAAADDERRYCVLNVSNAKQQDREYFSAIDKEMKSGGLAAMLYDLQKYDLRGFEVRNVPQTQGLLDQKKLAREAVKSK